jgi:glutaredoxin
MKLVTTNGCSICTAVKRILKDKGLECEYYTSQDANGSQIVYKSGLRQMPIMEYNEEYFSGFDVLKKVKEM